MTEGRKKFLRSAGGDPPGRGRGLFVLILTVVRLRALAGWRKALTEKAKLVFGVVLGGFLMEPNRSFGVA